MVANTPEGAIEMTVSASGALIHIPIDRPIRVPTYYWESR